MIGCELQRGATGERPPSDPQLPPEVAADPGWSTEQRERGFLEAIEQFPDLAVLAKDKHGGPDEPTAVQVSENLLATYGDTPEAVDVPEPLALDADRLAACVQALAERERTVVVQTFFADRSGDEVAKELGLSAGNVRVIRHRALGKLRECMGEAP